MKTIEAAILASTIIASPALAGIVLSAETHGHRIQNSPQSALGCGLPSQLAPAYALKKAVAAGLMSVTDAVNQLFAMDCGGLPLGAGALVLDNIGDSLAQVLVTMRNGNNRAIWVDTSNDWSLEK